ncbi:hypothetical protein ES703_113277 [subsurface metagenome]
MELVEGVEKTGRLVPPLAWESVTTLKKGLARLAEGGVDLVLLDLGLPDSRGLDTFLKAFDQNPAVPYVIISGYDDEELAIQAVREGAQDYLVKAELNGSLLIRTMLYAIERKQAREKIQEQNKFLEGLLDSITHPFYVLDVQDYTILKANSAAGFGPGGIGGKCYALTYHREEPCNNPEFVCPLKEVLRTKSSVVIEHIHYDKDGNARYTEVHGFPLFDVDGNVVQMVEYNLDITERKRLEQIIVETSERERTRIGQDLHDGLGQLLAGIKYMTDVLEKNLAEKAMEEVISVREITKRLDEAIQQTKTLAREIYPVKIHAEGFMSALQEYAMQVNRMYGVRCELEVDQPLLIQDHSVATHLFRIVQEAVNNAVHHASANQITIQIAVEDGLRSVRVRDNGVGLPEQFEKLKGVGVNSMKYRANVIGASLSIASKGTNGTVVTCTWHDGRFLNQPSEK